MTRYIYGGNTGLITPEELDYRRRVAQALIRSGVENEARGPWSALGNIAQAFSGAWAQNRISGRDKEGRAIAESAYKPIMDALARNTMPSGESLSAALSNPWTNDRQKLIAETLFKNKYGNKGKLGADQHATGEGGQAKAVSNSDSMR